MSLAREWRRQLYAASGAALIVPFATLTALVVLALGGGFSQIGVLGQLFAGPPAPSSGPLVGATAGGQRASPASAPIPVIPAAPAVSSRLVAQGVGAGGGVTSGGAGTSVLAPGKGTSTTGGAIAPGAGTTGPVTHGSSGAPTPPPSGARPRPAPPQPAPGLAPGPGGWAPSPQSTPVDIAVKLVTSVTEQVPGPGGSLATQAVQSAGSAADNLLAPAGSPAPAPPPARSAAAGLRLP
jgi:hypothetical protein